MFYVICIIFSRMLISNTISILHEVDVVYQDRLLSVLWPTPSDRKIVEMDSKLIHLTYIYMIDYSPALEMRSGGVKLVAWA